jgi:hypothetical protein
MSDGEWYWSLTRKQVVRADQRDRADEVLGPYPTEEAARNWKDTAETRNDAWDEADKAWEGEDES